MKTEYAGIDYAVNTGANTDPETGIRYGVVSINSLIPDIWDELEADYGEPGCPHCGDEFEESTDLLNIESCPHCEQEFDGTEEFYREEPLGFSIDSDGFRAASAFDNTQLFVLASPYVMNAQFCSPCAPGAGNCDSECEDGPLCFCPPPDYWGEDNAPENIRKYGNVEGWGTITI